ncbi:MAG: hypothetical protein AB7K52_02065 [Phycisphaerales bacterium]
MRLCSGACVAAAGFLAASSWCLGAIRYVDDSAPAGGNGQSWNTAYNNLATALQAAVAGDELRVAQGTYRPGSTRTSVFTLKNGVSMFGGYAGYGAPNPNARDTARYTTILSGDLNANDGPAFAGNSDNCFQVVTAPSTVSASTVFDGFVVTGGNADGGFGSQDRGGGMGVAGSLQILHCTFRNNSASGAGAMSISSTGSPLIRNCAFVANRATGSSGFTSGGAIHLAGNAEIACSLFAGNTALQGNGGAVSVATNATTSKIHGSVFTGNSAQNGGALQLGPAPVLNCTLTGNSASMSGGGINVASTNAPQIANCIIWDNFASTGGRELNGPASVTYSCVKDGMMGEGNILSDPLLLDPAGPDQVLGTADDNCRVASGPFVFSPCIDSGNNVAQLPVGTVDIDGNPRFADHPYVTNTGVGPGDPVDIGAYEPKPVLCNADFNADGVINADDLGDYINAYFTGCQ